MPADAQLSELVARIGAFHITDRAMARAQRNMESALARDAVDERTRADYLAAALRYFEGFDREARAHLHDVDRRLEHVNQVHFNLAAERGVAVKRIEGTSSILQALGAAGAAR